MFACKGRGYFEGLYSEENSKKKKTELEEQKNLEVSSAEGDCMKG